MTTLISTIRFIGYMTVSLEDTLFREEVLVPIKSGGAYGAFSSLRRGVKFTFFIFVVAAVAGTIVLVHSIITNEYAVRRITAEMLIEEERKSDAIAEYARAVSSGILVEALQSDPSSELVQIENIRYLKPDAVIQANALLQLP